MVYVNKPKPSKGYVSYFILGGLVFPFALLMITIIIIFKFPNPILGPNLFAFFDFYIYIPTSIILSGIVIHAAYNTEYRIEDGKLWMKFGHLKKGSVPLDEIKGIEKVEFIRGNWRLSSHHKSYCNRFKNGIGIITEKRTIWVSPEDSEKFVSKLGLKTGR